MHISNCEQKVDNINTLICHILNKNDAIFFKKNSVKRPDFINQELSFVRLVSWLYTLYNESGKRSINVIKSSMSIEHQDLYKRNSKIVGQLRTSLHHNLEREKTRNFKIEKDCHKWMKESCGKNIPDTEENWKSCSMTLLDEAEKVLSMFITELEMMTDSPSQKDIFHVNWEASITKELSPHIYDRIIEKCLSLMHINSVNIVEYRQSYYQAWNIKVGKLSTDSDYLLEATKIVEAAVIKDFFLNLPLTTAELNESFKLSVSFIKELLPVIYQYDFSGKSSDDIIAIISNNLSDHILEPNSGN